MDNTHSVYIRQGYGQRLGFGERPALLIVDFTRGFADPAQFGGGNIQAAIDNTVSVLAAARRHKLPIMFSTHAYAPDGTDFGLLVKKNPRLEQLAAGQPATEIVDVLRPHVGELVLTKRHPSIFFGTDAAGWLIARQVDTVVITGCTTSGCIRATAVDAMGLGFRPIVVSDCVGDRAIEPHNANLFDLEQKYADIETALAVERELETLCRKQQIERA